MPLQLEDVLPGASRYQRARSCRQTSQSALVTVLLMCDIRRRRNFAGSTYMQDVTLSPLTHSQT